MYFNYASEWKKFLQKQQRQADQYRIAGMTEVQIQMMYMFDLEEFRRERIIRMHTRRMPQELLDGTADDWKLLPDRVKEKLSCNDGECGEHSRYWWIHEIEDPELAEKLKRLDTMDIEILTQYCMEGYTQAEISCRLCFSQRGVSKKLQKIRRYLRKF